MAAGKKARTVGNVEESSNTSRIRSHKFESFTQRVARLKIDPIRKNRKRELEGNDLQSHFQTGLQHWRDSNLSESFSSFVRETDGLCDSLTQVLHHKTKIVEILIKYLQERSVLSLEPLLNLTSCLAHDLGVRFEEHFPTVLVTVLDIAAKHKDVEAVEWSFSCLAWLFKYLSALLVPDLRPTYDLVARALGKENHKPFVARFAAEALSFLIKKAASNYSKNQAPLDTIVRHIFADLNDDPVEDKYLDLYRYGIMSLFASAVKGVDNQFHTVAGDIFRCLLLNISSQASEDIFMGVLTSSLHHGNVSTVSTITNVFYEHVDMMISSSNEQAFAMALRLLLTLAAVRRGSRIKDWTPMFLYTTKMVNIIFESEDFLKEQTSFLLARTAAVVFAVATQESCLSNVRLVDNISQKMDKQAFLAFCLLLANLSQDRFTQFALPSFLKHLTLVKGIKQDKLLFTALEIIDNGIGLEHERPPPASFQSYIEELFCSDSIAEKEISRLSGILEVLPKLNLVESTRKNVGDSLLARVEQEVAPSNVIMKPLTVFYMGIAMQFALQHSSRVPSWVQMSAFLPFFSLMPIYLENLTQLLSRPGFQIEHQLDLNLINEVAQNLSSPFKELRKASLELLQAYHNSLEGRTSPALDTALQLEALTLDIKSDRTASMCVRRLSEQYQLLGEASWIVQVIALYYFGILHFKLGQARIEAIDGMKQMCSSPTASIAITDMIFEWLDVAPQEQSDSLNPTEDDRFKFTEFQCTSLDKFSKTVTIAERNLSNAGKHLQERHSRMHNSSTRVNHHCRRYALEVLRHLPGLAEKNSRRLVPIFLQYSEWNTGEIIENENDTESDHIGDDSPADQSRWLSRGDQLAFLEIFGLFANPRMLYKATEVRAQLLKCLSSGDTGVQKAALKALSAWKSTVLDRYMENFHNLLDEARFREEVTIFLDKENAIQRIESEEVFPVLLRVLYGRSISKTGSTSMKGSLSSKRRAVFDALGRLDASAIQQFADIALGPLKHLVYVGSIVNCPEGIHIRLPTQRQQLGLLNLLKDMVNSLGKKIVPVLSSIIPAVLFCGQDPAGIQHEVASTTFKNIRKMCLQSLTSISSYTAPTILLQFLPGIFNIFITPRLEALAVESTQSISAMLQLLAVWASSPDTCLWLARYNTNLLNAVTKILMLPAAKESVLLFVIDKIVRPVARFAIATEVLQDHVIKRDLIEPNISLIFERIGGLLESNPQKRVLSATLSLLSDLAGSVDNAINIQQLIRLSTFLLLQPASNVPPRSKGDILGFLHRFILLSGLKEGDRLLGELEEALVPLLLYFKDKDNRILLTKVLVQVARLDLVLQPSVEICSKLEAYSTTNLGEPDFDSRLQAFHIIESHASNLSERQWKPLIFSLFFHVQDMEELLIRSSASASLKKFIAAAAISNTNRSMEMMQMVESVVLPALRRGASHKSELVRLEYLSIFAEIVKQFPSWERVNDLSPLLVNDDEEASFFSNILHIQQHRRLRALRRLAMEASKGNFQSNNIAHFLIPLLEHFILDHPDDKSEHNIAFETINTLSKLAVGLEWPQFRAMFRRYTSYMLTNPDLEKAATRLLTMMTDALSQVIRTKDTSNDTTSVDSEMLNDEPAHHHLQRTLPKGDKLSEDIASNLSMPLRQYVHHKDEALVSQRVPVAVTVAKMIMLLSDAQIAQQLPPLLTDVCQILRSRAQESRDLARRTLMDISKTVGPPYFGFILKELRTALPRGYQVHVLSFTTHMLLVTSEATIGNGELDYCLPDIVNIIMDDVFGATGQEKDAEGYTSQMREIKANKSYDSMEIIARVSSMEKMNVLLQPIMALLEEKLDLRMLKKIDEILRRLGLGLLRNQAAQSQAALILCFELLRQAYNKDQFRVERSTLDYKRQRFLINMRSIKKSESSHATSSAVHKLARFAFDLLRTIFSRQETLQTPANVSGFMPVIGEGVMSCHEEVQISVFRLLVTIIRVPLAQLDENAPVYVFEAMNLIKGAATTGSESSQAALKLLTVFIRDRDNVIIKNTDVSYILKRIKTDLDEPDRQGITFNFLKAVLHRKVVVAETYELMDAVAAMMIQNQSPSARNAARGLYVQFLVNYPQGKDRLKKQWAFLTKNLDYSFEAGRQSVLEAIHVLLEKVGERTVQEIINNFFAPLVLATANDESMECRRMSAILLKEFFAQAIDDTLAKILLLLRTWLVQEDQQILTRIALQTFILYIESAPSKAERDFPLLTAKIETILSKCDSDNAVNEWELVYYSLQLLFKTAPTYGAQLFSQDFAAIWKLIIIRSQYPHAWVKSVASKLVGLYLEDFAPLLLDQSKLDLPLIGSGGLSLDIETMIRVCRSSLNSLGTTGINEEFASQLVMNIVFLGRFFGTVSSQQNAFQSNGDVVSLQEADADDDDTEDDDTPASPISFIFARVSAVLRRDTKGNRAGSMIPKTAHLQVLVGLCSTLPTEIIIANSMSVLMPLNVITDPSTTVPFSTDEGYKTAHAELAATAQELLGLLQTKLGSSLFIHALNQVREKVRSKRDDRRIKRRIEAVTDPEKTGQRKMKKRMQQREQRKARNTAHRAQRRGW